MSLKLAEQQITTVYLKFIKENDLNVKTGLYKNIKNSKQTKRFAAFPYIGSKYNSGILPNVLIIGLDIGKDYGKIHTIKKRRIEVEKLGFTLNPHLAGTYISTIYLLQDKFNLWNIIKDAKSSQSAVVESNILKYIVLTNYYKFVEINRTKRKGDKDRHKINKKLNLEEELLLEEISVLNPAIILFQGFKENDKRLITIASKIPPNISIYYCPHPSWHGTRQPEAYCKTIHKLSR